MWRTRALKRRLVQETEGIDLYTPLHRGDAAARCLRWVQFEISMWDKCWGLGAVLCCCCCKVPRECRLHPSKPERALIILTSLLAVAAVQCWHNT